jgi:hypothetical protein
MASRQRQEQILEVLHGEMEAAHVEHKAPKEDNGEEDDSEEEKSEEEGRIGGRLVVGQLQV